MEELVEDLRAEPSASPTFGAPAAATEASLAEELAGLLRVERVSVDSHFFEELGADSMVMAHFCARVRKRGDMPPISIKDIYQHPTIEALAASLAEATPSSIETSLPASVESPTPASTSQYVRCGALQLLFYLIYSYLFVFVVGAGYEWISKGSGVQIYLRAVLFTVAGFVAVAALPIAAKWLLIGRWKPQQIRVWSLPYVRFWIVKTLIRSNPCALLFVGSPLYVLYLRALGAKIGRGAVIFSRRVPVCTDLLTIGESTVIRRESFFSCYRARAGQIETGAVTLGRDVFIGERTVLDINTSMGDGAQLGNTSALHEGQAVPHGERWHGSPGQRTEVKYLRVAPAKCGTLRRSSFCVLTLLALFFLYLPLVEGGAFLLLAVAPSLAKVLDPAAGASASSITLPGLLSGALLSSLVLFFGFFLIGLPLVVTVTRLLNVFITPGKVYPLYGVHDMIRRSIARISNVRLFTFLFGDSSYIVPYLRCLGYRLSPVEQTGSNFGSQFWQATPRLSSVGTGTMVADGLTIVNDDVSSSSFSLSTASIGRHNFVGNDIVYPAGGRTGENCLLATKAMIPLEGSVHEGRGLLGSPSFEIPRSVDRDSRFDHLRTGEQLSRGLRAKNRYNLRTIGVFLLARWVGLFLVIALDLAAIELYGTFSHLVIGLILPLSLTVSSLYFVLVERLIVGFRPLQPTYCSIYHRDFWRIERYWKVPPLGYLRVLDGTPFKNIVLRLMGVRVGKRVFDDGTFITERTLATVGDDSVLNLGSTIQCHSQEDGTFKSDRTVIGAGCSVGVGALVHYGVTIGDGSVLAPDSFLMKGEQMPSHARWGGNPAREI